MPDFEHANVPTSGDQIWKLRLTRYDLVAMTEEPLEMIQDGLWLIEHALKGEHLEGPLTLPHTGLPLR